MTELSEERSDEATSVMTVAATGPTGAAAPDSHGRSSTMPS
jgi:hypothetical protein